MQYRPLGSTGMRVSTLGFGCGRFTDDEAASVAAVHCAIEAGINYFDVAPLYGATRAEKTLGEALRGIDRRQVFVATKIGRYVLPDGERESDFSTARVVRSIDESLARLGLDYVDVIQCHDTENADLDQIARETLPALRAICAAGKARYLGVTAFPLKVFRELQRRAPSGSFDLILSYGHHTLQNTALAGLTPTLNAAGLGIVNAAPFGMGFFTGRKNWWHETQHRIARHCTLAETHCFARGVDLSALALQFSVSHPDFATTLVSMPTTAQVRANVAALAHAPDPAHVTAVQAILAPIRDLVWPAGRPENN